MASIIVVDDDKDICEMVQYRLTTMGMKVDTFHDGEFGLEAIVGNPPDLAIVDMMMPKMNGLEVTQAVRANPATKELPIVIFTALDGAEFREAVHEAGTDNYVIKPFSVAALAAYVEKLLGLRTCIACGRRRGVDEPDYSPEQVLQHATVGWTVTVDGEICGDCRGTNLK
jgi:two-component system response regulator MtrA